jgi:hypothetical protein
VFTPHPTSVCAWTRDTESAITATAATSANLAAMEAAALAQAKADFGNFVFRINAYISRSPSRSPLAARRADLRLGHD